MFLSILISCISLQHKSMYSDKSLSHLDHTCCTVTWTLDLTRPRPAWRISSRAAVWKIWRLAAVAGYSADTAPPPARWLTIWRKMKLQPRNWIVL